ncbi:putative C-terminal domain small phosphatase [Diplonema papillatum]|nr:putative C-terminal domain small phosphatase [Diplonema papillatum]KAJ9435741.1 putative C-terminal domain small phosphatase [Diplonema papillatum]
MFEVENGNEEALSYLTETKAYDVLGDALAVLLRLKPEDPVAWLALFLKERDSQKADEEYIMRHNLKDVVNKAVCQIVDNKPQSPPQAWFCDYFRELNAKAQIKAPVQPTPLKRRVDTADADDDTPPVSPGALLRGRSFLGHWASTLQRYYLESGWAGGGECRVHAEPDINSPVVSVKREFDGIAVDKEIDGWLRITEGTGWVRKMEPGSYLWKPWGTEAGVTVAEPEIPGGFQVSQQVISTKDPTKQGFVLGRSLTDASKVVVRWSSTFDSTHRTMATLASASLGSFNCALIDSDNESGSVITTPSTATPAEVEEEVEVSEVEILGTRTRYRAPSMLWGAGPTLIPPPEPSDVGLPVIVFDLDETLIYARKGPLHARAGVKELFSMLKGKAEVIVWTAGMRAYAQAILAQIDTGNVVKHCVYRHPKWHPQRATGQRKNLAHLGRPLEHTLLVENSPESLVGDERNSVLLPDFTGGDEHEVALSSGQDGDSPGNT